MNIFKKIILILSVICIAFPAHAMESGDGDQGYLSRAMDFAKDNPGIMLSVGAFLGASIYVTKQLREARALYGTIWGPEIKQIPLINLPVQNMAVVQVVVIKH